MTVAAPAPELDRVTYHVADLVTGQVLDSLPLSGEVSKAVGEAGTQSWQLAVADERMPPDWLDLLQPVRRMLVAEWRGKLIQAWVIVGLRVGDPTVEVSGVTLERVLEKVYVRTADFFSVDEAQIAAEVASQVLVPAGGWTVRYTTTGTVTDYNATTDGAVTVKSALDTIAATDTGPRYVVDVEWVEGAEGMTVRKVLRIARDLGSAQPRAVFTGAMVESYTRSLDWSGDYAALRVWATTEGTTGTGFAGPYSSTKLDAGWHPWEAFVPFTDLNDAQLARRATAALADREDGATVWEVVCRLDDAPQLLDEWTIGDTVTVSIAPNEYDPVGGEVTARVEGWALDDVARTITPLLRQEGEGA